MNDFTASNGVRIVDLGGKWDQSLFQFTGEIPGLVDEIRQVREVNFQDPDVTALREFFQAEADERLGRWRDPAQPEFLVYPVPGDGSRVHVVDETTGVSYGATRASARDGHGSAAHYFAAHPEPKPWHDAVEGEVWALTIGDDTQPRGWMAEGDGPRFWRGGHSIDRLSGSISAGRRIWPEVAS